MAGFDSFPISSEAKTGPNQTVQASGSQTRLVDPAILEGVSIEHAAIFHETDRLFS